MDDQVLADVLRGTAILVCMYSVLMSLMIVFVYHQRIRFEDRHYIRHDKMARHVYTISFGMIIVMFAWAIDLYGRMGVPLSWRTPVLIVGFTLSSFAQFDMYKMQRAIFYNRQRQVREAIALAEMETTEDPHNVTGESPTGEE